MGGNENDEAPPPDLAHLSEKLLWKLLRQQRKQSSSVDSMEESRLTDSSVLSHNTVSTLESEPIHNVSLISQDNSTDSKNSKMTLPCIIYKTKDVENNTVVMIAVVNDDIKSLASSVLEDHSKMNPESSTISVPSGLSEYKHNHYSQDQTSIASHDSKEGAHDMHGTSSDVIKLSQRKACSSNILNPDGMNDVQSETDAQNFLISDEMEHWQSRIHNAQDFCLDDMKDSQSKSHFHNVQNSDNVKDSHSKAHTPNSHHDQTFLTSSYDSKDGTYYDAHNTDIDVIKLSQLKEIVINFLKSSDMESSQSKTNTQKFQMLDSVELEDEQLKANSQIFQSTDVMKESFWKKPAGTVQNSENLKDQQMKRLPQNLKNSSESQSKTNSKNFHNQSHGNNYSNHSQNFDDMGKTRLKTFKNHSNSNPKRPSQAHVNTRILSNQVPAQDLPFKVYQEKIAHSQMLNANPILSEDSADENVSFQRSSKSPWGPPHKKYPMYVLLNQPDQYRMCQIPGMMRDSNSTNPDRVDHKDYQVKESCPMTTDSDDKDRDETHCCRCCCSCMPPCAPPVAQNVSQCLVYPVFPMYCYQPEAENDVKNKRRKEKGKTLLMNTVHLAPFAPSHSSEKESRGPDGVRNAFSPSSHPKMRPANWLLLNGNSNSDMFSAHSSNTEPSRKPVGRRPPTVICYICGQEYGTASIGIHEKQCLKKWKDLNDQLPKSQRRPEPVKMTAASQPGTSTESVKGISGKPDYDLSTINDAAVKSFQQQYVQCDKCGRTFLPDSLKQHVKSCQGFHSILGKPASNRKGL